MQERLDVSEQQLLVQKLAHESLASDYDSITIFPERLDVSRPIEISETNMNSLSTSIDTEVMSTPGITTHAMKAQTSTYENTAESSKACSKSFQSLNVASSWHASQRSDQRDLLSANAECLAFFPASLTQSLVTLQSQLMRLLRQDTHHQEINQKGADSSGQSLNILLFICTKADHAY